MSSMQQQAQDAVTTAGRTAGDVAQQAIDRIPPDAWPVIDLCMRILIGLAILWLVLALIAWWRRRAYNLTVASSARRNKKAKPGFLSVDEKAREEAIARGEGHEQQLDEREADDARAILKAAAEPVSMAAKFARIATLLMSIITLGTGFTGAILNVTRVGDYLEEAGTVGKLEYLFTEYPVGVAIAIFAIGYNIWRYFAEKKWEKA